MITLRTSPTIRSCVEWELQSEYRIIWVQRELSRIIIGYHALIAQAQSYLSMCPHFYCVCLEIGFWREMNKHQILTKFISFHFFDVFLMQPTLSTLRTRIEHNKMFEINPPSTNVWMTEWAQCKHLFRQMKLAFVIVFLWWHMRAHFFFLLYFVTASHHVDRMNGCATTPARHIRSCDECATSSSAHLFVIVHLKRTQW